MYKKLVLLTIIFGLTTKCTSPDYELTGVVQDGLNGGVVAGGSVILEGTNLTVITNNEEIFL